MKYKDLKNNRGFVILFAVTLSAILLSIALGVANIALKEIKFGTSAKDTNNAFLSADSGIECALIYDKTVGGVFISPGSPSITCNTGTVIANESPTSFWNIIVSGLGSDGQGCAKVIVDKRSPPVTTVISKGYNVGDASCTSTSTSRVERELRISYSTGSTTPPPVAQNVTWQNIVGVCAGASCVPALSSNSIKKTAVDGWMNAGASSVENITATGGYVEFSVNENNRTRVAGLSNGDVSLAQVEIDYGFSLESTGNLRTYENGTAHSLGKTYVAGDIFRISVSANIVKYYQNGVLVYTSLVSPIYPLLLDTALNGLGSTIINAQIYSAP
jgi:hypothetical protein